jgi:hypothetical protein
MAAGSTALPNGKTAKTWPLNVMPYFRLDVDLLNGRI